ncbi:MAG: hypothetical protein RMY34_00500 [Aulosira sp. DedQUE10]|nr:hypothetical protein [Aulosira sp. DedQUE10]
MSKADTNGKAHPPIYLLQQEMKSAELQDHSSMRQAVVILKTFAKKQLPITNYQLPITNYQF